MNCNRIARRASRIGAAGEAYLQKHAEVRRVVRGYAFSPSWAPQGIQVKESSRDWARDRVFQRCKHWFGDKFSEPVSVAERAALRAACARGTDTLAWRARWIPGYYVVLAAARRGVA